MDQILKRYSILKNQNIPRETLLDFETFISILIKKNTEINLISKETAKYSIIRERHIIDSAQIIDFVDLNDCKIFDIGSGGGMPGIVIAIIVKNMKKNLKVILYEKSHHKSIFLRNISKILKLNTEVFQKDIFEEKNVNSGTVIARAFKPLPIVLELVNKNFCGFKNLVLFMGKSGEKILEDTLKDWDLDFEKKKSITSKDSFILNIKKIKKK